MLSKFESVREEELVLKYKECRDDDIEMELIERYKIHSKKLASELFINFKFVYQVEYEDLFSIALANLFVAIKSFKENLSFFKLWKRIATNDIKIYVTTLPLLVNHRSPRYLSTSRDKDFADSVMVIASPTIEDNNPFLSSEIERFIREDKKHFKDTDVDIYILLVSGFTVMDIAKSTGLKYHYVRARINVIKDKIQKYFVHS